ncbi:MAG: hypothetical protein HY306_09050 [Nitrosomonadales bacterium]|nr:hypothetical protein [Nitrosomonadales bacterium]
MLKLPQSIIFAIVAFNFTAFTLVLQLDILVFQSPMVKIIAWVLTIGAWALTYTRRKKYFILF